MREKQQLIFPTYSGCIWKKIEYNLNKKQANIFLAIQSVQNNDELTRGLVKKKLMRKTLF